MSDEIHMTISIPTDDEGYVLLKCEHCGTFFKGFRETLQLRKNNKYCRRCKLPGALFYHPVS